MHHLLAAMSVADLVQSYGLWVLFGVVALEGMGIPVPGETALVSAALYAGSSHRLSIVAVIAVAAAAAISGDNVGYLIGRLLGRPLVLRYGRYLRLTPERLTVGQYLFLEHGGKIVFLGRFVAILRTLAPVLAGVNRMRWSHFAVMNALGGSCWSLVFGGGAYFFGVQLKRVAGPVALALLAAAIVVVAAGVFFFRRHEKEIEQRAQAALDGLPEHPER